MSNIDLKKLALIQIVADEYNGDDDWWTSLNTDDGGIYDVNVYCEEEDTARISIYPCIELVDYDGNVNYTTDTENELEFFTVPRSTII